MKNPASIVKLRHRAYAIQKSFSRFTPIYEKKIPLEELQAEIIYCLLKEGDELNEWKNTVNAVRRHIRKIGKAYGIFRDRYYPIDKAAYMKANKIGKWSSKTKQEKKVEFVLLSYYENNTASDTIKKFDLPNTPEIRRALSKACPKPEKAQRTGQGERIECTGETHQDLILKGLNKSTAYRAVRRGYYYKYDKKKTVHILCFSNCKKNNGATPRIRCDDILYRKFLHYFEKRYLC